MQHSLPFSEEPFIIGMVHVGPLPGNPRFSGNLDEVIENAIKDAKSLEEGGVDGIMVENFYDTPYPLRRADPATVASLTLIVKAVKESVSVPVGVNVLRNCGLDSLAIASVTGASFIRVNALAEVVVGPEGILEPVAYELCRYRAILRCRVSVLADVHVKHAAPLKERDIGQVALETFERGLADAIVVSGEVTGAEARISDVVKVRKALPSYVPVIIGSGVTVSNVKELLRVANGAIVGTYFKTGRRVDVEKVKKLMSAVRELRRSR